MVVINNSFATRIARALEAGRAEQRQGGRVASQLEQQLLVGAYTEGLTSALNLNTNPNDGPPPPPSETPETEAESWLGQGDWADTEEDYELPEETTSFSPTSPELPPEVQHEGACQRCGAWPGEWCSPECIDTQRQWARESEAAKGKLGKGTKQQEQGKGKNGVNYQEKGQKSEEAKPKKKGLGPCWGCGEEQPDHLGRDCPLKKKDGPGFLPNPQSGASGSVPEVDYQGRRVASRNYYILLTTPPGVEPGIYHCTWQVLLQQLPYPHKLPASGYSYRKRDSRQLAREEWFAWGHRREPPEFSY